MKEAKQFFMQSSFSMKRKQFPRISKTSPRSALKLIFHTEFDTVIINCKQYTPKTTPLTRHFPVCSGSGSLRIRSSTAPS